VLFRSDREVRRGITLSATQENTGISSGRPPIVSFSLLA
jgi:hypothetical protein